MAVLSLKMLSPVRRSSTGSTSEQVALNWIALCPDGVILKRRGEKPRTGGWRRCIAHCPRSPCNHTATRIEGPGLCAGTKLVAPSVSVPWHRLTPRGTVRFRKRRRAQEQTRGRQDGGRRRHLPLIHRWSA